MTKPYKTYSCGCQSPVRSRILPCRLHAGPGAPAATARLQNGRLYRMAKNTLRERSG